MRGALAAPGIDDQRGDEGQVGRADPQDFGAVGGQRPAADRPGDDAGEVEYADPAERARRGQQFIDRGAADALDRDQGLPGERGALG